MNKRYQHLLLAACVGAVLALSACKQEQAAAPVVEAAPTVAMPTSDDMSAWEAYVAQVAQSNMDGVTNAPYAYALPGSSSEDFKGEYERLLERTQMDLSRGIMEGNMLLFFSPQSSSTQLADLVVEAFKEVKPNTMKNVKVLMLGNPADKARVEQALAPAGVNFVLVSTAN